VLSKHQNFINYQDFASVKQVEFAKQRVMQVVNEERAKLNGGRGGMRGAPGGMFRGGMGRGGPPGAFRGRGGPGGRGGGSGWPSGGGGYETQELFPVPSNKVSVPFIACMIN